MAERIYHFVPKERVEEFREAGWQESAVSLDGTHHGEYSVLMFREEIGTGAYSADIGTGSYDPEN